MKTLLVALGLLLLVQQCVPVTPTGSTSTNRLWLDNRSYEPTIKSVMLYPNGAYANPSQKFLVPAVLFLNDGNKQLILEFDDLSEGNDYFFAKILHCNADWTRSNLRDLEFLSDYNEFPLNNWAYSSNTREGYVHYTYNVPAVKIPGNYVLAIYRNNDINQVVLTHRFMVVENRVVVKANLERPLSPGARNEAQRVTFTVDYNNLDATNPRTQFSVLVRQNRRWDVTRKPQPSQIREGNSMLLYQPLDETLDFPGGNEFRWFETRNLNFPGQNVGNIKLATDRVDAYILEEKSRGGLAYGQIPDYNGGYIPRISGDIGITEGDYLHSHFLLNSDSLAGAIYVVGDFNNWRANEESRMRYNGKGGYEADLLLKQGWYNYQYLYKGEPSNPWRLEGSHFATENDYEIFVYYRPLGSIQDLLVGYTSFTANPR